MIYDFLVQTGRCRIILAYNLPAEVYEDFVHICLAKVSNASKSDDQTYLVAAQMFRNMEHFPNSARQ